jgi:hypothetical protein
VSDSNPLQLNLEITAGDATDEEIDQITRQLLSELSEVDVESVELTKGKSAPRGSKGDPVTIGSLALVVLPAVLPKVVDAVQAWALRGKGRTVKFRGKVGGQMIEFEGSSHEFQKLMEKLEKGKRK